MSYFIIAFVAGLLLSGINISFYKNLFDFSILKIFCYIYFSIIVVFAIDALIALFVKMLPEKLFNKSRVFKIFKWEKNYYQKIGIKKWKDKVPEWGKLANFSKKKLLEPNNNEYIARFIIECKYGEVIHFLSIILGFLVIFVCPLKMCLSVGLPIGIINAFLNYPSLCILRYNRPKLETLYKLNERKALKRQMYNCNTMEEQQ